MADAQNAGQTTGTTSTGQGVAKALTQSRDMKCYIISDFEMHGLSNMNGACTFCVGMATAFAGIGFGLLTSKEFTDPKTISAAGQVLAEPGATICFILTAAFSIAAIISFCRAKGAIKVTCKN